MDLNGKIMTDINVDKKLDDLTKKVDSTFNTLSEKDKELLDRLRKEKKYILIGDEYYSTKYQDTIKYFNLIKMIRENKTKRQADLQNIYQKQSYRYSYTFIGYDDQHNSYWDGIEDNYSNDIRKQIIVIYSKYGEVLDAFYYGEIRKDVGYDSNTFPTSGSRVTV